MKVDEEFDGQSIEEIAEGEYQSFSVQHVLLHSRSYIGLMQQSFLRTRLAMYSSHPNSYVVLVLRVHLLIKADLVRHTRMGEYHTLCY